MKKALALAMAAVMAAGSLAACGGSASGAASSASASGAADSTVSGTADTAAAGGKTYDSLTVGKDATDLKADIKVITNRTDLVDTTFKEYVAEFQKMYPNINISYEGITNYGEDMTTRLTSNDWGDICMIPSYILKTELGDYFEPLCDLSAIQDTYNQADLKSYSGKVYGIPSMINVQGVVYNKAVFEKAGITALPKTPDEFLTDLQSIKDKTDAIPLYTNYAAGWTMGAWDAYISGSATGDADWMNVKMPHTRDPFAKGTPTGDEKSGPYAVYNVLYQAVKQGLTEDDPTTTDWEGCKPMINSGKIGCLVLGSWAVSQMQAAGANAGDIAYMSFPITVNGKQYATAGADYAYGVNKSASDDNKLASMLYIKWLTESSNYYFDQGGVPTIKSLPYPDTLKAFDGVELVFDTPNPDNEADLQTNINNESEVSVNNDNTHVQRIVEAAINGNETLDDIVADWNTRWDAAMDKYGA